MSWILAHISEGPGSPEPVAGSAAGNLLHVATAPGLHLAAGGIPETCLFGEGIVGPGSGWAVTGLGMQTSAGCTTLLGTAEWAAILSRPEPDVSHLDGHFVAVRWRPGITEWWTDQLGLRTLFHAALPGGFCVSTRLEWTARAADPAEPDLSALGGTWLLSNQLGYDSGVRGIGRVGPAGRLSSRGGKLTVAQGAPWMTEFGREHPGQAEAALRSIIRCALSSDRPPSLGLSGGLDSRLLLALLAAERNVPLRVHTFGDAQHPDRQSAERMASLLALPHTILEEAVPAASALSVLAQDFACRTHLVEPVSSVMRLRHFSRLREQGVLMLDGGFGEILRRQYLNRVFLAGRRRFRKRDAAGVADLLRVRRGDFFAPEVTQILEAGAREEVRRALDELPAVEAIGLENALDLLAVRTRVPNFGSPEQARLDELVPNFMPLVQPSLLRAVFRAAVRHRRGGKLHRALIRRLRPELAEFPLVKGDRLSGFGTHPLISAVRARLERGGGRTTPDADRVRFLDCLREYVLDLGASREVRENPLYEPGVVRRLTEEHYRKGRGSVELDWWLTFHLWSTSLSRL
jgi:hypothetical protein